MGVSSRQVSVRDASARARRLSAEGGPGRPSDGKAGGRGWRTRTPYPMGDVGSRALRPRRRTCWASTERDEEASSDRGDTTTNGTTNRRRKTSSRQPAGAHGQVHKQKQNGSSDAGGPPVRDFPWRTQWGPGIAVGLLPPFACAPSVSHVECAGVSARHFNPTKGKCATNIHACFNPARPSLAPRPTRPYRAASSTSVVRSMEGRAGERKICRHVLLIAHPTTELHNESLRRRRTGELCC